MHLVNLIFLSLSSAGCDVSSSRSLLVPVGENSYHSCSDINLVDCGMITRGKNGRSLECFVFTTPAGQEVCRKAGGGTVAECEQYSGTRECRKSRLSCTLNNWDNTTCVPFDDRKSVRNGCSDIPKSFSMRITASDCHAEVTKIGGGLNPCAVNSYTGKCTDLKNANDIPRSCEEINENIRTKCHRTVIKDALGANTAVCTNVDLLGGRRLYECLTAHTKGTPVPLDDAGMPIAGTCKPRSQQNTKEIFDEYCGYLDELGPKTLDFEGEQICGNSKVVCGIETLEKIATNICQGADKTSFVANDALNGLEKISNQQDCNSFSFTIKISGFSRLIRGSKRLCAVK